MPQLCCSACKTKSGPCLGRVGTTGVCANISRDVECFSRAGRGEGAARQWTSCTSPKPLCVPNLKMNDIKCTAAQERENLRGLNNTLAAHHDHVKALCAKAASCVDPATYREALRTLENQVKNIRAMYEQELANVRKQLDEVNQDRGCLVSKACANSNLASSLQARLGSEESTNKKAHENLAQLQALLAQKEKEVCDLRACLNTRDRELSQLKPRVNQLCCEVQELRSRLVKESEARIMAEERCKQLGNKFNFDATAACEANKDLQDRLNAANDIIACLEKKIDTLTEWAGRQTDTAAMLKKLRDGTCQELNKYKKEAEDALNGVIDAMKCQRDADNNAKTSLVRDKASLEECLRQTQAKLAEAQSQLTACCQEKSNVVAAFEKEKACAQARINDLEQKLNDLTDLVATKVKDATLAREAQAALNAEINTYRNLLETQEAQFANCAPCSPCAPRPAQARAVPEVKAEPVEVYCAKTDMRSKCAPCVEPSTSQPYNVAPRPDNTYHKQGDYSFQQCGPTKPFQPSGATGLMSPAPAPSPPAAEPFKCPKGKGKDCTCKKPGEQYQTTYMKSFSPAPQRNPYGTKRNACFRRC